MKKPPLDVANLGQVFTPESVVNKMLALRKRRGRTLEPSAGNGAFTDRIPGCVAIELDHRVAPPGALVMDFFDYPTTETFASIVGNPPYVRHQDILPATKAKLPGDLFDRRSNLYLYFIEKCVRHLRPGGELILIVPREFIKLTAARKLNAFLFAEGTITDYIETGDSSIFGAYVPNCAIFRFEKGRMDRRMHDGRVFAEHNGQLMFLRASYTVPLADLFEVKVGAVSGADPIFTHPDGIEMVCSTTIDTGLPRRMIYGEKHPHLEKFKEKLLTRRVKKFAEHNWWEWGRAFPMDNRPRIYVNSKTRRKAPFFIHDCKAFDGSIMALFPKSPRINLRRAAKMLNEVDWADLGFVCDGRHLFSQRSLETCYLPSCFASLLPRQRAA
jgi:adenine-specific DNA-methyltransferase